MDHIRAQARSGLERQQMIRISIAVAAALTLSACGGGSGRLTGGGGPIFSAPTQTVMFATGPIYSACLSAGRKAATRARCGCVQAVADKQLSGGDIRRGAKLWKDPGKLQEIRQSDNPGNARFWKAWKAFGQSSEAMCKGS